MTQVRKAVATAGATACHIEAALENGELSEAFTGAQAKCWLFYKKMVLYLIQSYLCGILLHNWW